VITRYIRLNCSLCLLALLVRPLTAWFSSGADLPALVEDCFSSLSKTDADAESAAQRWQTEQERLGGIINAKLISQALQEQFAIPPQELTVGVYMDETGGLQSIRIGLSGAAVWQDSHAIERWIEETLCCPAVVYIE
jgi:hypothetical protein